MKSLFNTNWKSSKQPRKQRKYLHNAPLHTLSKLMSAHLSKELRTKHQKRSLPVRKGDEVKIMKGKFKGRQGKVREVEPQFKRVSIEGIQNSKKDGTKVEVWFHPSNLLIKTVKDDSKRFKINKEKKNAP